MDRNKTTRHINDIENLAFCINKQLERIIGP